MNEVKVYALLKVYECLDGVSLDKEFLEDEVDGKGEVLEKYGFMEMSTSNRLGDIFFKEDKALHREIHGIELFDTIDDFVEEMEDREYETVVRGDAQIEFEGFIDDMIVYIQH